MQPSPPLAWWQRDGNGLLIAASVLYAALYLLFWPVLYSTMDESAYMNLAYAFDHGTVYLDVAHVAPVQSYLVGPHRLSLYPPGMGALLALPGFLNWNLALGFNLLVHLSLFWTVAILLRLGKTPVVFALLYLLHPGAVLFSRTVMSDLPASLCLTLGFLATLKRRYFLCGVLVGIALFVRTASAVAGAFLVAGVLLEGTRFFHAEDAPAPAALAVRVRRAALLVAGVLPFFIAAYLYQKIVQDGGWAKYAQPGMVSVRYLPVQLPFYTGALLILYPGLLLAPFFYRGPGRAALLLFTGGFFAFYCCFYFHDEGGSKAETFLVGQRFLLVILPLMIVAYSRMVWKMVSERMPVPVQRVLAAGVAGLLFVGSGLVHRRHAAYLHTLAQVRGAALQAAPTGDPLLCNVHVAKLIHPGWAAKRTLEMLPAGGTDTEDAIAAEKIVRQLLSATHHPVTVALWSRAYRPETPHEMFQFHALETDFATQPLPPDVQAALPADLHILRIVGERKGQESR